MRLTFRHQAFKAAISAVLATTALGLMGCDSRNTPDGKAAQNIANDDFQAAAKEKGASPAITALAAKVAASEQVASALPAYQNLVDQQIAISQKLWQIDRLNFTAQRIAASAAELTKYKPDAALAELDKTLAQVKGGAQKEWTAVEGVSLPAAATSLANANALKDKIAETQRTLAQLKQKHQQLSDSARQLMEQSDKAKGEQAVNLFKQSADTRKQANEVAVQIDQTEASLVPLEQDLKIAEDQAQQSTQTLDLFASQRDVLEKGWRGVAAQMEQRTGYAGQVYSKVDDPQFSSVALGARELAQLTDDYAKQSQTYQQKLDGAGALVRDAISSAEKALREFPRSQAGGKGPTAITLAQATLDPSASRVLQGQIQYDLGSELGIQAALTASELQIADRVAQVGAALKQPVPESMNDAARAKLKTEQGEQTTKAGDSLKAAAETFDTAKQANTSPDTRQAAAVGQMIALADSAGVLQTAGDAAGAKEALDKAKELRDNLLQSGPIPGLPGSLQGAAPAAPAAAPAEAPATPAAPAAAPAATPAAPAAPAESPFKE